MKRIILIMFMVIIPLVNLECSNIKNASISLSNDMEEIIEAYVSSHA